MEDDPQITYATCPEHLVVVGALLNKGISLTALGRHQEAIAIYDELLAMFTSHRSGLRREVEALRDKASSS